MQFVSLILIVALLPVEEAHLVSLAGTKATGTLEQLNREGARIGEIDFPAGQIASISFDRPVDDKVHNGAECNLVDDSRILVKHWKIADQVVLIEAPCGELFKIKTRDVRSIKSRQQPAKLAEAWQQISNSSPVSGDAIVIQRGGALETLEGRIGDVADEKLSFTLDDQTAGISLNKIEGMVFYHATGRELVSPICQLTLIDGSTLNLRDLNFEDDVFSCESVAGVKFDVNLTSVSEFSFGLGRSVFLSEMELSSAEWNPLIASSSVAAHLKLMSLPKRNRAFDGKPLTLIVYPDANFPGVRERREFLHGFAVKSGSKLAFALDENYQQLTGLVGFDPKANASGNVQLAIRGDGKLLFEQVLTNERFANPVELDVDVSNVSRLVIEVDYFDGRAVGDVLHFCELEAIK